MKISSQTLLLVGIIFMGCVVRKEPMDGLDGSSQVSEVKLGMPAPSEFPSHFGKNCRDVSLPGSSGAVTPALDQCPAVVKLLSEVHLKISMDTCSDGVVPTKLDETRSYGTGSLNARVQKGCTYTVLVEVGKIRDGQVIYSNSQTSKGALTLALNSGNQVNLKVVLEATTIGSQTGFPQDKPIVSNESADLDIQTGFAKPKVPAPSSTLTTRIPFSQVNAVLKLKCTPCHALGGKNPEFIDDEVEFLKDAKKKIPFVEDGLMPPDGSGKFLSQNERDLLLRFWRQGSTR